MEQLHPPLLLRLCRLVFPAKLHVLIDKAIAFSSNYEGTAFFLVFTSTLRAISSHDKDRLNPGNVIDELFIYVKDIILIDVSERVSIFNRDKPDKLINSAA